MLGHLVMLLHPRAIKGKPNDFQAFIEKESKENLQRIIENIDSTKRRSLVGVECKNLKFLYSALITNSVRMLKMAL